MTTPELIDYIRKATDAGMSRDEVERMLLQHDWDPEDIVEAYLEIGGKKQIVDIAGEVKTVYPNEEGDKFREPIADPILVKNAQPEGQPRRVDLNRQIDPTPPMTDFVGMEEVQSKPTVIDPKIEMPRSYGQSVSPLVGGTSMVDMQNKLAMGHVPGQTFSFQAKTSPASQIIQPAAIPTSEPFTVSKVAKSKKKSKIWIIVVLFVVLVGLVAGGWFLTSGFTKPPFRSIATGLDPRNELNQIWTTSSQSMSGQVVLVDTETTYTLAERDALEIFLNEATASAERPMFEGEELAPIDSLVNVPFTADQLIVSTSGVYDMGRSARQHTASITYGPEGIATADIRLIEGRLYLRPTFLPDIFDKELEIQNQWYVLSPESASAYLGEQIQIPLLLESLVGGILSRELITMSLPLILREDVTNVVKTKNNDGTAMFDVSILAEANVMANETASLERLQVSVAADMATVTGVTLTYNIPSQAGGAISITSTTKMVTSAEPVNILPPNPEQDLGLSAEERDFLGLEPVAEADKPAIIDLSLAFERYQKRQELASIEATLVEFEFDAAEYFTANNTFAGLCRSISAITLTGELVKNNMSLDPLCSDTEKSFVISVSHLIGSQKIYQCLDSTGFIGSVYAQPIGNSCQTVL